MTESGLRERKKRQTRLALRTAALRLTAERGLDGVTVEAIAAAADVSVRTFFNYFPTKEAAVVGVEPGSLDPMLAVLAARPAQEEPLRSLQAVFRELATGLAPARELHLLRRQVVADNPSLLPRHVAAFAEFERVLVAALQARTAEGATADPDPALVVALTVAAVRVSLDHWVDSDEDTDLADLLDRAIDRLATGLVPSTDIPPRAQRKDLP